MYISLWIKQYIKLKSLNCKGTLIDFSIPRVMGIINTTPDSFYDGKKPKDTDSILHRAEQMLTDGATFLDIGGYSSRPSAKDVSEDEELQRVLPAIEAILKRFPETLISVDTYRSNVAKESIEHGAAMINDISAGHLDENMLRTVASLKVPYIMMHMRGTPKTMQDSKNTEYKNLITDIFYYFTERIAKARALGIDDVIIDLGFGFAKTREQNYELLDQLDVFKKLNTPILTGISRKSMIYKTLNILPDEALNGTTLLHAIALQRGSNILRVHDVKEAIECIQLMQELPSFRENV